MHSGPAVVERSSDAQHCGPLAGPWHDGMTAWPAGKAVKKRGRDMQLGWKAPAVSSRAAAV